MPNLFRTGPGQWLPDADEINAPEGALLRSDNLVEDETGALSLRAGSELIYTGLGDTVDVIHTVELADGTVYRVIGAGDRVYINGVVATESFDGAGDIAIGDDSYQIFMARGTTKRAFDGQKLRTWGIPMPIAAPTLTAVDAITVTVADFNNVESPAVTAPEGSMAYAADDGGNANEAITLTPATATSRGSLERLWTQDQDFYNIKGTQGSDNDQLDFLLNMAEPRNVDRIVVQFGVGNSSTSPFNTDRYEFTLDIKNGEIPNIKDVTSAGYAAYEASVLALLKAIDPSVDVGTIQTPEEVKAAMAAVGDQPSPKTGGRPDPGTWSHLTVTRGSFKRIGATSGRDWKTVRGFRITYVTRVGTVPTATFSNAIWSGGGDLSLTGAFRACFRAGRDTGQYIELSPPSAASAKITLNHQTLKVTIAAATLSALAGYADQLWIYLFGGLNLNTWYRFAVTGATTGSGMRIDELSSPVGSNFNSIEKRTRLSSHGFTFSQQGSDGVPHVSGTTDLVVNIVKSEEQALSEGLRMEPYQIPPPDNIIAVVGPWAGRMFAITEDGSVWPSSNLSPSSFNSRQRLDLTRYGDPLWGACTTGGIFVGMTKDIVFLEGSGDDSADLTYIDLAPRACGVGNPPIDRMVTVEGSTLVYRSADGPTTFNGASVTPVAFNGTELLWRGQQRHGVGPLNTGSGRFRLAFRNYILYMLAPEGTAESSNVIYRLKAGNWRRLVFAAVNAFRSILAEPSGALVAGDDRGNLWQLETGEQDNGSDVSPTLWTPSVVAVDPLTYTDPMDLQLHVDTGGDTGQVAVHVDGAATAAATFDFSTTGPNVYRIQASEIGSFIRAQLRITGSFTRFALSAFNLSHSPRAQHYVLFDTGHFSAPDPQAILKMQEAEVDCISPANLLLDLYLDDGPEPHTTQPVVVLPGRRSVYSVPLPRGSSCRRPRIVLRSLVAAGSGACGFDLFKLRVRARGAGNDGSSYLVVYQAAA